MPGPSEIRAADMSVIYTTPDGKNKIKLRGTQSEVEDGIRELEAQFDPESVAAFAASPEGQLREPNDPLSKLFAGLLSNVGDDAGVSRGELTAPPLEPLDPSQVVPRSTVLRNLGLFAGNAAIGVATGGASVPTQIASQAGGGFLLDKLFGASNAEAAVSGGLGVAADVGGRALAATGLPGRAADSILRGLGRVTRAGRGAVVEGVEQASIPGIMSGSRPATAPFRNQLVPDGVTAQETAASVGASILPADLTQAPALQQVQNIIETSFTGGRLSKLRNASSKAISDAIEKDMAELAPMSTEALTQILAEITEKNLDVLKGAAQGAYRSIQGTAFAGPLKAAAREIKDARVGSLLPNEKLDVVLQAIEEAPNAVSFGLMQRWRTELRGLTEVLNPNRELTVAVVSREAGKLVKVATQQMERSARRGGTLELLREADRIWAQEVRGVFADKFIKNLVNKSSLEWGEALMRARATDLHTLRKVVGEEAFEQVRGTYMRAMLERSAVELVDADGFARISGAKYANVLLNPATASQRAAIFRGSTGAAMLQRQKNLARALQLNQDLPGGQRAGSVMVAMSQSGAMKVALGAAVGATAASGNAGIGLGAAGAIILGPIAAARAWSSKNWVDWLTVGVDAPPGTVLATRAGIMLASIVARDALNDPAVRQNARDIVLRLGTELRSLQGSKKAPPTLKEGAHFKVPHAQIESALNAPAEEREGTVIQ